MELSAERLAVRHLLGRGRVRAALEDLSLRIGAGEHTLICGWAGSGKTTLLKCLAGLIRPTSGHVDWDGHPVYALTPAERQSRQGAFGMIFQNDALFDSMTILENVELPLRRRQVPADEARARALEMLEAVGLRSAADSLPEELSGGMRKRVGLARALVGKPEVLLADDPLSGLDPATAREITSSVAEIARGRTLLWASPAPPPGLELPRWIWLAEGRLVHDGPPCPERLELESLGPSR